MKNWLKGGLWGLAISFILFIIISGILLSVSPSDMPGAILILLPPSLIAGFILGGIFGKAIEKFQSKEYKFPFALLGTIIGLIIGIGITYTIDKVKFIYEFLIPLFKIINYVVNNSHLFSPANIIILVSLIIGGIVGWIIGKRKSSQ